MSEEAVPVLSPEDARNLLVFLNSSLKHEPVGGLQQAKIAALLTHKLELIGGRLGKNSNSTAQ